MIKSEENVEPQRLNDASDRIIKPGSGCTVTEDTMIHFTFPVYTITLRFLSLVLSHPAALFLTVSLGDMAAVTEHDAQEAAVHCVCRKACAFDGKRQRKGQMYIKFHTGNLTGHKCTGG